MNKKQNSKQKIQKLAENDARPERAIQPTELLNDTLRRIFGCELADATQKQVYRALCISVRELLTEKNRVFGNRCTEKERKEVYYMSMEFLVGTSLRNNLFNLGLEAEFRKALADAGFDIDEIYAIDPDAGLGNGGLGRLASCYMDAATGMDYPMTGFSIRYEFGIFKQKIVDGWQMEFPDNWLEMGDVWLHPRKDDAVEVRFGGEVREWMDNDRFKVAQVGYSSVMAVPYDMYISGYDSDAANRLVLWSAKLPQSFDMAAFSRGDYVRALERNAMAETISKVLYPADDHIQGKRLRLKQQYLLVSASLQSILKKHYKKYRTYTNLPDKVAIHINDTHPALCVPELMRLLIDEHDFGWDEAWDITCRTLSYTNHTVMSEALERWNVDLFREQLPRVYSICQEINRRLIEHLCAERLGQDQLHGRHREQRGPHGEPLPCRLPQGQRRFQAAHGHPAQRHLPRLLSDHAGALPERDERHRLSPLAVPVRSAADGLSQAAHRRRLPAGCPRTREAPAVSE